MFPIWSNLLPYSCFPVFSPEIDRYLIVSNREGTLLCIQEQRREWSLDCQRRGNIRGGGPEYPPRLSSYSFPHTWCPLMIMLTPILSHISLTASFPNNCPIPAVGSRSKFGLNPLIYNLISPRRSFSLFSHLSSMQLLDHSIRDHKPEYCSWIQRSVVRYLLCPEWSLIFHLCWSSHLETRQFRADATVHSKDLTCS